VLDSGITAIDLVTTEVESQGNLAYEVGTYAMKMKDGKVAESRRVLRGMEEGERPVASAPRHLEHEPA
jgi:hypothetical protein